MAVYKKTYRRYDGPLTPAWSRFLVPVRYAFEDMRRRRFLSLFFLATLIWPVLCAVTIYLNQNLAALKLFGVNSGQLFNINARFFLTFLGVQSMLAFFLASFVGPGLVSPDLANNALPLYLARPYSRAEYVLSKFAVLATLLSAMTWVPGLMLYGLQGYMQGGGWAVENLRIAAGLFLGSAVWIMVLSLLALALSAWVKWKPVAGALMFGVFFVAEGFGAAVNEMLDTRWGGLLKISDLVGRVWLSLFESTAQGPGAVFFGARPEDALPVWSCWLGLTGICACCLFLLARKVRGVEIVRG